MNKITIMTYENILAYSKISFEGDSHFFFSNNLAQKGVLINCKTEHKC